MHILKQSTASQSILLGPFVDSTDGATAETGLTIANTDIRLSANGGNMAAKNSGGGTHDENGWYAITLDATDTATVGRLQVSCVVSGALPVHMQFQVIEEAVYDDLFAASATGYSTHTAANVRTEIDSNSTQLAAIVADTNELQTDNVPGLIAALNDPTVEDIADAVCDEALAGHTTLGTLGDTIDLISTTIASVDGKVDGITDDTNELQSDWTDGGRLDLILDAILIDTAEIGAAGAGLTAVPWNAAWDAEVQSEVADALTAFSVVATTDLPTNFADMTIEVTTGIVDSNVQKINDTTIVGNGVSPKFGV